MNMRIFSLNISKTGKKNFVDLYLKRNIISFITPYQKNSRAFSKKKIMY